jgi:phosphate transport system ATP-binding protein
MTISNTHISIQQLNVTYGKHHALKNINVEIPKNQITVIIGSSGCGKTTLLKSCNRLLELSDEVELTGHVLIDDIDIYNDKQIDPIAVRRKVGMLAQKPFPLPMSIYDNVAYGPRIHGLHNKSQLDTLVERYLIMAGLWDEVKDRLKSPATKLSAGQQQRLCLARCLAVEPEIILGDEPTSALDPVSSQRIEKTFLELKRSYTLVIVSHILRQARRLADYILFLYLGELIEHGPAETVLNNPVQDMTRAYIKGDIS